MYWFSLFSHFLRRTKKRVVCNKTKHRIDPVRAVATRAAYTTSRLASAMLKKGTHYIVPLALRVRKVKEVGQNACYLVRTVRPRAQNIVLPPMAFGMVAIYFQ